MYSRCHVCRHALGTNSVVQHMRTGQRLAYDVDRGRLWVVCPGCGEWNLTPMEERWEVLEECEALYRAPETRASSENIGISHAPGIDLIRIGSALRDELATGATLRCDEPASLCLRILSPSRDAVELHGNDALL